jgi:hypothetical protein
MNLDIGRAFTFVTEDPNGVKKVLIGGLMAIAMFIGFFLLFIPGLLVAAIILGYLVGLCRNVINGQQYPLPEWDDFGTKMSEGFKAIVVNIVYALPVIIVNVIFVVPQIALSMGNSDGAAAAGTGIGLLGNCLSFILGLLTYLVLPIGMGRLAASGGNIGYALQFGEVFATLRQNIGTYVVIALLAYFVGGLLAAVGLIACGVGAFFTGFYAQVMQYHLYGQAQQQAQGTMQPAYGTPYGGNPPYGGQRPF